MAVDMFMKFDGIDGESTDDKHKNEIEVLSYSWGASNSGQAAGGGGGSGKASMSDFSFSCRQQKSSPVLFQKCVTGAHIASALLSVRKSGGNSPDYYKITLSDVLVSSFQESNSEGGDSFASQSISLNFAKFHMEYTPTNQKGQLVPPSIPGDFGGGQGTPG